MAEFFVRNSLNLNKAVRFNIAITKVTPKSAYDGDPQYVIELGTTHSGINPNKANASYIYNVDLSSNLDEAVQAAISDICSNIDWEKLEDDHYPPYISRQYPTGEDVSIWSTVLIDIEDNIPTSGIDLSEMRVFINNGTTEFEITDEVIIKGDPMKYSLKWNPKHRVLSTYGV